MTRATPVIVSDPVKNALLDPEAARTTLFPVDLQVLRAAWRRLVSSPPGGDERCDAVNCADNVEQTAGAVGCDTLRLSPVARVEPPPLGGGPAALLGLDEVDPLLELALEPVVLDEELEPAIDEPLRLLPLDELVPPELEPATPELLAVEPDGPVALELPPGRPLAPPPFPVPVPFDALELVDAPPPVVEPGPDVLPP
jgi:hypothetical protein